MQTCPSHILPQNEKERNRILRKNKFSLLYFLPFPIFLKAILIKFSQFKVL